MSTLSAREYKCFEDIKRTRPDGTEYWTARELAPVLDYAKWENFYKVIKRAMIACENSGRSVSDDFPEVRKIVEAGATRKTISDYELSRYACYLIVQNGDPRKEVIALGQTYFAIQTYRQEVADRFNQLDEDSRRLVVRGDIKQWNQLLAETARSAGVITAEEFAIFQNAGYMGLYGGMTVDDIHRMLFITLPNVFHHMASSRLWGIFFFIFMSFAALSTVIAVFENIITMSVELWDWSRKKSLIVNLVMILVLTMPAVFGFNLLKNIQPMGAGSTIMDLEDFLVSSNLLPLGSLVGVLFCVRKNGWGWENFIKEANTGKGKHIPDGLRSYMAYVVPALICFIYLKGYYDTFSNRSLPVLIGWMCFAVILLALIFWAAFSKSKKNLENPIDK